jgi:hypothetical protein
MFGRSKLFLAAAVVFLAADSAAFACGRLPTGAACYVDDQGFYRSLYDDWRGIVGSPNQQRRPSRTRGTSMTTLSS